MAKSKNYVTYVLGPVKPLNECRRIVLCRSSDFSDIKISLYTIDKYLETVRDSEYRLILSRKDSSDSFKYRKRNITWISDEAKRLEWGFDIIIYLDSSGLPLGYTKYKILNGTGRDNLNITLDFSTLVSSGPVLVVDTDLGYVTEEDEINKYIEPLATVKEALSKKSDHSWYSNNLESGDIILFGPMSVIGKKLYKIDFIDGGSLNPYGDMSFDYYSMGYYGGDDIALFCWGVEEDESIYNIISVAKKDHYSHPVCYVSAVDGRAKAPDYNGERVRIKYISGKYLSCYPVSDPTITLLYDTKRKIWLDYDGVSISNPQHPGNKIYNLINPTMVYSEAVKYIPEMKGIYLDLSTSGKSLIPSRVIGPWVVFDIRSTNYVRDCVACGPTCTVYMRGDELDNTIFLNDTTLVLCDRKNNKYYVYGGIGKTFCTPRYKKEYPGVNYDVVGPEENNFNIFRRQAPLGYMPNIITGFGGILFYLDNQNRLYYL